MLGQDVSYDRVPYFFTDQYDLGMEYSGLGGPGRRPSSAAATPTAASSSPSGSGRAAWTAGMNVNVWDVTEPIQELIRSGREVPVDRLADPAVPLEDLV